MGKLEYFEKREIENHLVKGWGEKLYLAQEITHYGDTPRLRAGDPGDGVKPGSYCGDCACAYGEYHVPGCDMERCPSCGGQKISCNCLAASG